MIFGWSGIWDNLPAAHAAAITFDLLTMLGLFVLGWTIRGPTTGVVLAYLWAAYPFTSFVLMSNSNDALVALLIVVCAAGDPLGGRAGGARRVRGADEVRAAGARAAADARHRSLADPSAASVILYAFAYVFAIVGRDAAGDRLRRLALRSGSDAIAYQANRPAPFSIWGLWGGYKQGLHLPEHIVLGAAVALGLRLAVLCRAASARWCRSRRSARRSSSRLQMGITYWFYLYIIWFFPLVVIALVLAHPDRGEQPEDVRIAAMIRAGMLAAPGV